MLAPSAEIPSRIAPAVVCLDLRSGDGGLLGFRVYGAFRGLGFRVQGVWDVRVWGFWDFGTRGWSSSSRFLDEFGTGLPKEGAKAWACGTYS